MLRKLPKKIKGPDDFFTHRIRPRKPYPKKLDPREVYVTEARPEGYTLAARERELLSDLLRRPKRLLPANGIPWEIAALESIGLVTIVSPKNCSLLLSRKCGHKLTVATLTPEGEELANAIAGSRRTTTPYDGVAADV